MKDKWTQNQIRIHEGLCRIGREAGELFESAMLYYHDESMPNRVGHLAHAAREIDGGLRGILSPKELSNSYMLRKIEGNYVLETLHSMLSRGNTEESGHIKSILIALNIETTNAIAEDWIATSTEFRKYAHRIGIWKGARDYREIKLLWEKYEGVLLRLVGSVYGMLERLERLMRLEVIDEAAIGTIANLIKTKVYADYWFSRLDSLVWFSHLNNAGLFQPENIVIPNAENEISLDVFNYLLRIAKSGDYGKELLKIINDFVLGFVRFKQIDRPGVWWKCAELLNSISNEHIYEYFRDRAIYNCDFCFWLSTWLKGSVQDGSALHVVGEELLSKFLRESDRMLPHAETIISVITRIKSYKEEPGPLSIRNAGMVCDPHHVLDAFEAHHKAIGELCSIEIVRMLIDRLNTALEYRSSHNSTHLNIDGNYYQIDVERILKAGISEGGIDYEKERYNCTIGKYSPEQIEKLKPREFMLELHGEKPDSELTRYDIVAGNVADFKEMLLRQLPQGIEWQKGEIQLKAEQLFNGLFVDYSQIWFRSLAEGCEYHERSASTVLTLIVRDVLVARCEAGKEDVKVLLTDMLSDRYRFPVFKKIVLYVIDRFWKRYADLFAEYLRETRHIFDRAELEVELFDLLKHHNSTFCDEVLRLVQQHIDNVPAYYQEDEKKAYWYYKWLSPMHDHESFRTQYIEAKSKIRLEKDEPHEPARKTMSVTWGGPGSPKKSEEIGAMSLDELVRYIAGFTEATQWDGKLEPQPSREGLALALKAAVKDNPDKYVSNLSMFSEVPYLYQNALIRGVHDAWKNGTAIDWGAVLAYCHTCITSDEFGRQVTAEKDSAGGETVQFIVSTVDLVDDACRDEKRYLQREYFATVENIFTASLMHLRGEDSIAPGRDAMFYALNTPLGRAVGAYMSFSLLVRRTTETVCPEWGKSKYDRFLDKGIDAYFWLGHFLPNINYLDGQYVTEKIGHMLTAEVSENQWLTFMRGYLSATYVYPPIYKQMRKHFERAIAGKVLPEDSDKRLVQHIATGYLRETELLTEKNSDGQQSLLWLLLDGADEPKKHSRWFEMAMFLWLIAEDHPDKVRDKALAFWRWTYEQREYVKSKLGDDYGEFLGKMSDLTMLLATISAEQQQWLILVAPHIRKQCRPDTFLGTLAKMKDDESVKRIGAIVLAVLKGEPPMFMEEQFKTIVENMYEVGKTDQATKEAADEICVAFGRRGQYFLKEVFEQNNYGESRHAGTKETGGVQ